jgi:AcrR family transcriptional regulator
MKERKKNSKTTESEGTIQSIMDTVAKMMEESGHTELEIKKIVERMGRSKETVNYHFNNVNDLLKYFIKEWDYWPAFFKRFNLSEHPDEAEIRRLFIELMQDNLKKFKETPEMQRIILWQISAINPMLRSVSDARELDGAKLLSLAQPYFIHSNVSFKAVIALLLGGTYYLVLHSESNKSTVSGIDINWERDMDLIFKTIGQIIGWAWDNAKQKQPS